MEPSSPIEYLYRFRFADGKQRDFRVQLDPVTLQLRTLNADDAPPWAALGFHQCPHCPLGDTQPHCPAALSVVPLVNAFGDRKSFERVHVEVHASHREYLHETDLQSAVSALMGLHMVTAGCPVLDKLRPMVDTHLPFMTPDESTYRMISMYLTAQYFLQEAGFEADFRLRGFRALLRDVRQTNQALCDRMRGLAISDSTLNALTALASMGEITEISIAAQDLERLRTLFLSQYRPR